MQLNIRTDAIFIRELDAFVRESGLRNRTAAIKKAVHDALQRSRRSSKSFDFHKAIGVAGKLDPNARFKSDDDIYEGMP